MDFNSLIHPGRSGGGQCENVFVKVMVIAMSALQTVSADELFGRTRPALKMNRFGFITAESCTPECAAEYKDLLEAAIAEQSNLLDATNTQLANISTNRNLTGPGKVAERDKIAQITADKIKELANRRRQKLDQDLKRAEDAVPRGDIPAPKDVLELLRHQEVRSHLRSMDPLKAESVVLSAAQQGQWEVVGAASHDPLATLMKPSTKAKLTEQYHRTFHPAPFARVETVREAKGVFDGNLQLALKSLGKIGSDDPIMQRAAAAKPVHDPVKNIEPAK